MSSSVGWLSGVGAEEQAPIYCHSGIDLFVNLKIDPIESRQVDGLSSQEYNSDSPKFSQTLCSASVNVDEEAQLTSEQRVHDWKGKQLKTSWRDIDMGSRTDRKPSCANIDRRELDGNLLLHFEEVTHQESRHVVSNETSGELERPGQVEDRRPVPEVGARKVLATFVSPSEGHIVGEPQRLKSSAQTSIEKHQGMRKWNDYSDERFSEHHSDNLDLESLGRQFGCGFHSKGNLVRGFHDLLANWKARLQDVENENPGPCEVRSSLDEEPYVCIENRSWSPLVEDYSWVERLDISRDSENRMTGCSDDSTWLGDEMDQDRATLPSSSPLSENEVVMQLEQAPNPNLEMSSTKSAEIESFDGADVLAARTIVELSAACRKEMMEQELYFKELMERERAATMELSAITGQDVHNLGFRNASCEGSKSAKVVEKAYATLPDVEVRPASNALKPRSENLELSLWGDEDRYIPRIVRAKGRPRGSNFSTRVDFVNSEFEEESEDEVLQRSPRKRRYKSTQELYC